MATKKQRRRREKGKRHEYEVVWVDEAGREVDAPDEPEAPAPSRRAAKQTSKTSASWRGQRGTIQPPSWRRTARRGLIFAPLMFATVMLLGRDLTTAQQVVQTAVLLAFFVPFSYFLDSMMWRSHQKRLAKLEGSSRRR